MMSPLGMLTKFFPHVILILLSLEMFFLGNLFMIFSKSSFSSLTSALVLFILTVFMVLDSVVGVCLILTSARGGSDKSYIFF